MTALVHRRLPWLLVMALLTVPASGCLLSSEEQAPASNWSGAAHPELVQVLGDPDASGISDWPDPIDNTPDTHDFDGDGVEEIIAHSDDTNVYVFDADSGDALASFSTTYPPAWHVERILNEPVAASLNPGEPASIVVSNHAGYVSVWTYAPQDSEDDELAFHKQWEKRMDGCDESPSMDAGPVLADLTDDGSLEILAQTEEQGFFALEDDGSVLWEHCWAGGNSRPVAADLGEDGTMEAIFASDSGFLSVIDGASGNPLWTFDASQHVRPASVTVAPTIADLDGEAPLEILFTARNATHAEEENYEDNHVTIFAIRGDRSTGESEMIWMRQPEWANPLSYTRLIVEDVDDDGRQDIFGMDWNTMGHRPGNWTQLGPANVFRLDADGEDVWVRQVDSWWSNVDLALADFDGDGTQELLVKAPVQGKDGLWRLDAETGGAEGFLSTSPWKVLRAPEPVDLDGDGSMELVFPVRHTDESLDRGAVLVYEIDVDPDFARDPWHPQNAQARR